MRPLCLAIALFTARALAQDAAPPPLDEALPENQPGMENLHATEPPTEAEVAQATAQEDAGEAPVSPPAPHFTELSTAGWVMFSASLAVGVLGGILLAVGVDELGTVENAPDGTRWSDLTGSYERAPIFTGFGAVTLVLGAAGTAVGAILLAISGPGGSWLRASIGPGQLSLSGRF